jgi:hypothetical protein
MKVGKDAWMHWNCDLNCAPLLKFASHYCTIPTPSLSPPPHYPHPLTIPIPSLSPSPHYLTYPHPLTIPIPSLGP